MMRETPKADPARALRERAGRLRAKAKHIVRQYGSREGDDAWSWLLDTAELCELAADAMIAENERLEKLEALRSRLQMFLAAVGASTPDDHPWVVEARALANALRPCELATPAPAPQQGGEP